MSGNRKQLMQCYSRPAHSQLISRKMWTLKLNLRKPFKPNNQPIHIQEMVRKSSNKAIKLNEQTNRPSTQQSSYSIKSLSLVGLTINLIKTVLNKKDRTWQTLAAKESKKL